MQALESVLLPLTGDAQVLVRQLRVSLLLYNGNDGVSMLAPLEAGQSFATLLRLLADAEEAVTRSAGDGLALAIEAIQQHIAETRAADGGAPRRTGVLMVTDGQSEVDNVVLQSIVSLQSADEVCMFAYGVPGASGIQEAVLQVLASPEDCDAWRGAAWQATTRTLPA